MLTAAVPETSGASNIEIKARLSPEQLARVREHALARASAAPEVLRQRDTFYTVPRGRLKLRELGDGTAELIAYQRPDRPGPAHSSYVRAACADAEALHEALARTLGVRGVVEKRRELVRIGPTRVHLDEVVGLGTFVELEVVLRPGQPLREGEEIAGELVAALGIAPECLIESAYIDLLEAGKPASDPVARRPLAASRLRIVEADFDDPAHRAGIVRILDSYASDPVGGAEPLAPDVRERLVAELQAHPMAQVLLALADREPVGVAVCFQGFSTFQARPLLNVHDLAVLPASRGRGIGRALLRAAEDRARRRGCCKLTLEVQDDNRRAYALYESFGFSDFVVGDSGPTRFLSKPLDGPAGG